MYIKSVQTPKGMLDFKCRGEHGVVSSTVTDEIVLREAFEENTYALHEDDFSHTGVLIDIGANIGAVSFLAWSLGAKKIVSYEPESENRSMLLDNLALNPQVQIEVHPEAVWSFRTTIPLVPSQGATTSRMAAVDKFPDKVVQVPTVTLADVLSPFDEVDVLKVDTEGAEYEIFNWDLDSQKKCRKIVMEFHQTCKEYFGDLLAQLVLTHNVQAFGRWHMDGGQILALRY